MSEQLRPISAQDLDPVEKPADLGPQPELQWLPIAKLVIDGAYQRDLLRHNRARIRDIAAAFDWRKFATIIVAPVGDGHYAIIDGQHRATAAALINIESVPAQIMQCNSQEAAAAFSAINGSVTLVSPLGRFKADIAAGVPEALELAECCRLAGVTVVPWVRPRAQMKVGETVSISMLKNCLKKFGADTLTTALCCITQTKNNYPGAVNGFVVQGICEAIHEAPRWRENGEALFKVCNGVDLLKIAEDRSQEGGAREKVAAIVRRRCNYSLGAPAEAARPAPAPSPKPSAAPPIKSSPKPLDLRTKSNVSGPAPQPSKKLRVTAALDKQIEAALAAAISAWPSKLSDAEPRPKAIKVAASVALVEAGNDNTEIRKYFGLQDLILPFRDQMPQPGRKCADAAVEALRGLAA